MKEFTNQQALEWLVAYKESANQDMTFEEFIYSEVITCCDATDELIDETSEFSIEKQVAEFVKFTRNFLTELCNSRIPGCCHRHRRNLRIKSTFQNEAECNVEDITNYKL